MGQRNAKEDAKRYREGYPGQPDDPRINDNFLFYTGQRKSKPMGDYIDTIHSDWWGQYEKLEVHHGYIQWIFPIREAGMNGESFPLQLHEIEKIKASPEAIARLMKSYDMQLDFYGCIVKDRKTGELARNPTNYQAQYRNLNTCSHNYLRITRILKCLGEFGFEHYKAPFLRHFIQEIWVNRLLTNCANSCANFWVAVVKDDDTRHQLQAEISKYTGQVYSESSEESNSDVEEDTRRAGKKDKSPKDKKPDQDDHKKDAEKDDHRKDDKKDDHKKDEKDKAEEKSNDEEKK